MLSCPYLAASLSALYARPASTRDPSDTAIHYYRWLTYDFVYPRQPTIRRMTRNECRRVARTVVIVGSYSPMYAYSTWAPGADSCRVPPSRCYACCAVITLNLCQRRERPGRDLPE